MRHLTCGYKLIKAVADMVRQPQSEALPTGVREVLL